MKKLLFVLCFFAGLMTTNNASSQGFLKKLKDKVSTAVGTVTGAKTTTSAEGEATVTNTTNTGKPTNKGGAGLTNTPPPDVKAEIAEAETAHAAKNYSDARYSLQQALLGVEIQLGQQILKSLPATVDALNVDTTQDVVMSTQWGWNNMSIHRVWKNTADKQLTVTIGNAGIYSSVVDLYFSNAGMMQANGSQQNIKQVRVKGNKAIIQYEASKGYTLLVTLGQSSLFVLEGVNFANEQEVMSTANTFDIDGIKKLLGEQ